MPLSPERAKARARHNGLKSHHGPDAPETQEARAELRALALEDHIRKVVDAMPPLTEGQRSRLAALLQPSGGA